MYACVCVCACSSNKYIFEVQVLHIGSSHGIGPINKHNAKGTANMFIVQVERSKLAYHTREWYAMNSNNPGVIHW